MFDIGFWEMALIFIIGLVVLGPERLPIAIRSVMKWVNTAKTMANSVKTEISQELKIQEMNENMIRASKKGLDDLDPDLKKSIDEMKAMAKETVRPYPISAESLDKKVDQRIEENSINPHPPKKEEKCSGDKS
jgi:sec-independent protein translocase protein TatB